MNKIGLTPGKLATAGILAAVLVTVLVLQTGAKSEPAAARDSTQRVDEETSRPDEAASQATAMLDSKVEVQETRQWPEISLEEAIEHDPFAVPEALAFSPPVSLATGPRQQQADTRQAQELKNKREQALAMVRDQGVQMVLVDQEEQVAIVGDRVVHIGEVLEGFRIVAINSAGIILSEQAADSD